MNLTIVKTLAIIVVLIAANAIMIISIKNSFLRVDYSLKKYFATIISNEFWKDFPDYVLEEKAGKTASSEESKVSVAFPVYNENITKEDYKNSEIKKDYKTIKSISKYTPEYSLKLTKDREKQSNIKENENAYKKILDVLDFETVCKLNTLDSQTQIKLIKDSIDPKYHGIVDDYADEGEDFDSIDFYSYLKIMDQINDNNYILLTGNSEENGTTLKDGSKIITDENIVEGTKVIHGNKLYDYSM